MTAVAGVVGDIKSIKPNISQWYINYVMMSKFNLLYKVYFFVLNNLKLDRFFFFNQISMFCEKWKA